MALVGYLDCFSGISGDMLLGALVDAGWPFERLQAVVTRLDISGLTVSPQRVTSQNIAGTLISVNVPHEHVHRHRADLVELITRAAFPAAIEQRAIAVIDALALAESKVHGIPVEEVHFHEVGAVDTLVDIVGGVTGLADLGVTDLWCAPLPWSHGQIQTAHGLLPVPPPAVVELLTGLPVVSVDVNGEMVTPTGAALVRTLVQHFGLPPTMRVQRTGYGAGTRQWPDRPNLLRLVLGEPTDQSGAGLITETLTVLACNLDDMNPQWYGPLMDALFAAGALDVCLLSAQMKKNRPATVLEVLCRPDQAPPLREIVLRHSTTLGLRQATVTRYSLERRWETVETAYGAVRIKIGLLPDGERRAVPEHDDCTARALDQGVSVREVWLAALEAYRSGA